MHHHLRGQTSGQIPRCRPPFPGQDDAGDNGRYRTQVSGKKDPRGFLESYGLPLAIDEIQKAAELLEAIKEIIDKKKEEWLFTGTPPQLLFVLTGSNQIDLRKKVGDSLAGRTAIVHMTSLSFAEIAGYPQFGEFEPKIRYLQGKMANPGIVHRTRKRIFEDIYRGGMPEYIASEKNRNAFFTSYVETYLGKDVAGLVTQDKIPSFFSFMQLLALRTACPLNCSDLANKLGVSVPTVKNWIDILVTTKIIVLLEPYAKNLSNRIVKTPKVYFLDTGLCSFLGRWPNAESLENGPLSGEYYETYVISEILKSFYNQGYNPDLISEKQVYYYRDRDQREIDFIIETFDGLYPIEIKKGINPSDPDKSFNVLEKFNKHVHEGLIIDSKDRIVRINGKAYEIPIGLIGA